MQSRIDLLNNLYHSNARQIDQLVRANAEISRAIVNIVNREHHTSREQSHQYATRSSQQQSTSYESDVRDALLALIGENTTQPLQNRMLTSTAGRGSGRMNGRTAPTNTPYTYTVPITNQSTINRILESFLAPIDIYPTQAQIETATRVARYGDITRPPNTSCPISLDSFEDSQVVTVIRHCGHIFNTEQIGAWFRANCRCPVCRYDIRNYRGSQHILDVSANTPVNDNGDISTDEEEQ
jgi:hypothetical protein